MQFSRMRRHLIGLGVMALAFCILEPALAAKPLANEQQIATNTQARLRRIALIIANETYSGSLGRLPGTRSDAERVRKALLFADFQPNDIIVAQNLGLGETRRAIADFVERLQVAGPNTEGFLYYTGHGMVDQSGQSYLVPIDADIRRQSDLQIYAEPAQDILDAVGKAGSKGVIVVFDACRTVPTFAKGSKGILPTPPTQTLVAYSTQLGEVASDEGFYSTALANAVSRPGSLPTAIFSEVNSSVYRLSSGAQRPQFVSNFIDEDQLALNPATQNTRDQFAQTPRPATKLEPHPVTSPSELADPTRDCLGLCQTIAPDQLTNTTFGKLYLAYGSTAVQRHDFASAKVNYETGCHYDNLDACVSLGELYGNGKGVPKDLERARVLFGRACAKENAHGCLQLGVLYREGNGVDRDSGAADSYFSKAKAELEKECSLSLSSSCSDLAALYLNGLGVPRNFSTAKAMYEKACEGGDSSGCLGLGVIFEKGVDTPRNLEKADQAYSKACMAGNSEACESREKMIDAFAQHQNK